ncbi:HK97 gp10 family phage protein [Marinilabilia salmonicolor]|jgi:hypothetical protein|uniref:Bacteriophage HK97-gp10 putative tail-component n=1 Tax=Marinilabilia salmonicolor TaxID=989 RepID=A0A368VEL9_9BACT|nr:HK97 gp10 family phage protein [Marinilabilia salmonicolor]RCW38665.1 bacteriophage HK97-gp10 putative tail-component [Marinilabilia salmonicolor]
MTNTGNNQTLQIFGTKELNDLFEAMSDSQQRSLYISAFRKMTKPLLKDIKSRIPSNLKGLRRSIIAKPVNREKALKFGASRKKDKQAYLANIFEGGTGERFYVTRKNKVKKSTGRVQPLNFFYDTIDAHENRLKTEYYEAFLESFEKMVDRYNKKKKRILK